TTAAHKGPGDKHPPPTPHAVGCSPRTPGSVRLQHPTNPPAPPLTGRCRTLGVVQSMGRVGCAIAQFGPDAAVLGGGRRCLLCHVRSLSTRRGSGEVRLL